MRDILICSCPNVLLNSSLLYIMKAFVGQLLENTWMCCVKIYSKFMEPEYWAVSVALLGMHLYILKFFASLFTTSLVHYRTVNIV